MPGRVKFLVGLANDEVGYIIPKSEWDDAAPWLYGAPERHYGEINSLGPETAPADPPGAEGSWAWCRDPCRRRRPACAERTAARLKRPTILSPGADRSSVGRASASASRRAPNGENDDDSTGTSGRSGGGGVGRAGHRPSRHRQLRSVQTGDVHRQADSHRVHQPALVALLRGDRARRQGVEAPLRDALGAHAAPLGLDEGSVPGRPADHDRGRAGPRRSRLVLPEHDPLRQRLPHGSLRPVREGPRRQRHRGARRAGVRERRKGQGAAGEAPDRRAEHHVATGRRSRS